MRRATLILIATLLSSCAARGGWHVKAVEFWVEVGGMDFDGQATATDDPQRQRFELDSEDSTTWGGVKVVVGPSDPALNKIARSLERLVNMRESECKTKIGTTWDSSRKGSEH